MKAHEITVAKHAGFCFGVKRATDMIAEKIASADGDRIFTLGKLIHNDTYNSELAAKGVGVTSIEELEALAKETENGAPVCVFIRAHGVTKQTNELLSSLTEKYPRFSYVDCTCPYVKKIHKIAAENSLAVNDGDEPVFILIGAKDHPEVVGIVSYFEGESFVCSTAEELQSAIENKIVPNSVNTVPIVAAQTTQKLTEWKNSLNIIKKVYTKAKIFDTICNVTEIRQLEAEELAKACETIIVIGGRESSNTAKLFAVCSEYCKNTICISEPQELDGSIPSSPQKVGIVAGASTPGGIIEEVYNKMSEMKLDKAEISFDEMLDSAIKTLSSGDTVTGTVIAVNDVEIKLDLGAKVTGILTADQISDDASLKLSSEYKIGDEIDVFVIRVSDVDGCATVSKKRADLDKNWHIIVDAKESGENLEGVVAEAVKGGVVIKLYGARIFVPASQTTVPKGGDLSTLVGQTVKFKVIELKGQGKSAVGSIRASAREERKALESTFWAEIEEGKYYTGKVRGMTEYGAFIDLGGVDGMLHKREMSWKPIHKPADILNIGDELTVFVKSFDLEKKQITLGYRTEETHPWKVFKSQYAEGDVLDVTVSNIMSYGAFAKITDDVDGLIHVSQIALTRVENPADVLTSGQNVTVKITKVDDEQQRVSLSIRALLEETAEEPAETEDAE